MFVWEPRQFRLPIGASDVLHIEETLADTPVTLPGLPSQNAGAYLVAYNYQKCPAVTFALRLSTSGRLAFYQLRGELTKAPLQKQLDAGRRFAESLGFLLSNVGFGTLEPDEAGELWRSMPLQDGKVVPTANLRDQLASGRTSLRDQLGRFLVSF
ncbi:MAG: hypothetical protein C0616_09845 [Desulfuromonas sp.]|nr:MAG: hypothetical protein C0616_09845 [Desulfuromonas sp.]